MRIISVVLLSLMLIAEGADAISNEDKERLAEMFSPILILTEETRNIYDDETVPIRVIKPEPVEIVKATNIASMWFDIPGIGQGNYLDSKYFNINDLYLNQDLLSKQFYGPTSPNRFNFDQSKFAFLKGVEPFNFIVRYGSEKMPPAPDGVTYPNHPDGRPYVINSAYFDYPGKTAAEWNNTYFGTGEQVDYPISPISYYRGANHPNTAYVHIDSTTHSNYSGKLYVIQYHYFYPYNDWWNNHEGDWQRIDVVVSSSDPDDNTIEVLGVEYRFHGAWVTYYKNFSNHAGLTPSFDFSPRENLKLSQGTHPVVYVGAGSHAAFPVGGPIRLHNITNIVAWEYMTHIGLVLSTQADNSHRDLWESYNLVLLPDPVLNNINNMGLAPDMSWLGAQIRWGTPQVSGPIFSQGDGNESPDHGPYNSKADCFSLETVPSNCGWGELKFDEEGAVHGDPFPHDDLPYEAYHHWAIIGDETWSGTVNLLGDVVVFPGATLTIEAGTVVEFASQTDRHQFSGGFGPSLSCLSEIFVYGTLTSEGDSGNRVVFRGPSGSTKSDDWGGIHKRTGGVVTLGDHTDVLNGTPIEYEFPPGSGLFSKCAPKYPSPVLIGALDPEVEESLIPEGVPPSPVDVGVYTNTDPNSNQPVWSLIGADASTFSLVQISSNSTNERTLQFKKLLSYSGTFSDGNFNHGDTNHIFGGLGEDFKIFGQASKSAQPGQGAFDNPAFGNHLKSVRRFSGDIDA